MQAFIEQANCQSYIKELHAVAVELVAEDSQVENALTVIELIEDGKYLEAVQVPLVW
jgi:hypothetical protein